MTDLTAEFFAGFDAGGDCFAAGNPEFKTSPAHMAFEAGRWAAQRYARSDIKGASTSRGYSVRVLMCRGPAVFCKVDYNRHTCTEA